MWLETVLWWHEGSNSSQCSSTEGKGCWPTYIRQLWPCWWQADAMIACGILDISQHDTDCLAFKEVQPSNPQESKLVCVVLSLLLWNKAWRHCKAYDTNYEWWAFKSMDHLIFMVIICLWYITPNDLNQHWRRSKSNSVCYHGVHESVATMGESLTSHISTHENPVDICTKIIPSGWNETRSLGWSNIIWS
jgi:hypothetical protein